MEDFRTRQSLDATGFDHAPSLGIGDPFDMVDADDPLGDEAAFPSTWQHLTGGEAPRD